LITVALVVPETRLGAKNIKLVAWPQPCPFEGNLVISR